MNLITDRTRNDVVNDTQKGNYDWNDLNRVSAAVLACAELFLTFGFRPYIDVKTTWTREDYFPYAETQKYIASIHNIAQEYKKLPLVKRVPELPISTAHMDYTDANNIEECLSIVLEYLNSLGFGQPYCGDYYLGE